LPCYRISFFFSLCSHHPITPLCPYTTLFRSSQMRPGNPHVPSAKYRPRPELAAPLPRRTDLEINSTSPQQKEKGHHNPANPRNIARREKDEHRENPDPGEGAKRQTSFPLRDHDSRLQPILRIPDLKNSGAAITAPMRHPTAIDNQGL